MRAARLLSSGVAARTIHVFHPQADAFEKLIGSKAPEREVVTLKERADFDAAIPHARVIFAPFPPSAGWAPARRLELVQLAGVGVDHFFPVSDMPASVEIAGMRGAFSEDAAEHAMTMLLALARQLPSFLDDQREHTWRQRPVARLRGRKLAILGLGGIGRALAPRAAAFGMQVRGMCRRPREVPGVANVVGPAGKYELLAWCDALVVALPRTPETQGLIDAGALKILREGTLLVHLARGGIIDEDALVERLEAGVIRAALDVFEGEPLPPESRFWDCPNLIVTPHVAGFGEGYLEKAVQMLLENVVRLERGEPRFGLVDRSLGY